MSGIEAFSIHLDNTDGTFNIREINQKYIDKLIFNTIYKDKSINYLWIYLPTDKGVLEKGEVAKRIYSFDNLEQLHDDVNFLNSGYENLKKRMESLQLILDDYIERKESLCNIQKLVQKDQILLSRDVLSLNIPRFFTDSKTFKDFETMYDLSNPYRKLCSTASSKRVLNPKKIKHKRFLDVKDNIMSFMDDNGFQSEGYKRLFDYFDKLLYKQIFDATESASKEFSEIMGQLYDDYMLNIPKLSDMFEVNSELKRIADFDIESLSIISDSFGDIKHLDEIYSSIETNMNIFNDMRKLVLDRDKKASEIDYLKAEIESLENEGLTDGIGNEDTAFVGTDNIIGKELDVFYYSYNRLKQSDFSPLSYIISKFKYKTFDELVNFQQSKEFNELKENAEKDEKALYLDFYKLIRRTLKAKGVKFREMKSEINDFISSNGDFLNLRKEYDSEMSSNEIENESVIYARIQQLNDEHLKIQKEHSDIIGIINQKKRSVHGLNKKDILKANKIIQLREIKSPKNSQGIDLDEVIRLLS